MGLQPIFCYRVKPLLNSLSNSAATCICYNTNTTYNDPLQRLYSGHFTCHKRHLPFTALFRVRMRRDQASSTNYVVCILLQYNRPHRAHISKETSKHKHSQN